ncbi:MarR family winged helix-turn-helix transcriptional regulator [Lentzea alba]|uniref:MarR family winged helix-turn-helix transcriptional regulator n=1 Tax=Lentzea alba TaxID=2714351 RepID=UPI001A940B55|nr:MarR family winged helix-turn-helix transcriptional regulator [Lentzea alba]
METRWLDDGEHRAWRAYRALTLLMEDTLDQQLRRDAGISHMYYSVLVFLTEAPGGRLRMTDLAEALKIARSRLTYTISRMADDGLVRREGDPSDRRGQFAVVTAVGRSTLERAAPGHVATVRGGGVRPAGSRPDPGPRRRLRNRAERTLRPRPPVNGEPALAALTRSVRP